MEQQNIDRVNRLLEEITATIEQLRNAMLPLYTTLDSLDDALESIEIKVDIIGAHLVEEERKERLQCKST